MKNYLLIFVLCISVNGFGQTLLDYHFSSCSEKSYPEYIRHRIISQERTGNITRLSLGIILNCCIDPELELSVSHDSLFVKIVNNSDVICGCSCCFELEMEIGELQTDSLKVIYMKEETVLLEDRIESTYRSFELKEIHNKYVFPTPSELIEFENYNGVINQFDEKGNRIGLWRETKEPFEFISYYELEENGKFLSKWNAIYLLDGTLQEICGSDDVNGYTCASAYDYHHLFEIKTE